jgi:hypothetical protein
MKTTRTVSRQGFAAFLIACLPLAAAAESIVNVKASVLIHRSQGDVFSYVSDVENDIHWRGGIVSIRRTPPGPIRVGARVEEVMTAFGKTMTTVTEVVDVQPSHRIASRSIQGPAPLTVERTVVASDKGTVFTYALRTDIAGMPTLSFLRPLVQWHYQRQVEGFLEVLRAKLEAAAPPSRPAMTERASPTPSASAPRQARWWDFFLTRWDDGGKSCGS